MESGARTSRPFDVVLEEAEPDAALWRRAVERLASILALQAQLRIPEVARQRDLLAAKLRSEPSRVLRIDCDRADELSGHLMAIRDAPVAAAEERLGDVLSLVGGVITCVELGAHVVAARLQRVHAGDPVARALLLPAPSKSERFQLQVLGGGDPDTLHGAGPRCWGTTGRDYFHYALNRLDLRSLFLVAAGYVRMNRQTMNWHTL